MKKEQDQKKYKSQINYMMEDSSRRIECVKERGRNTQMMWTRKKYETKTKSRVLSGRKETDVLLEGGVSAGNSKRKTVYTFPRREVQRERTNNLSDQVSNRKENS
jgi:hypothetical protein